MRVLKYLLPLGLLFWQPAQAQAVLDANPGPSNNGGSPGTALLFDVEASTGLVITGLTTETNAAVGANFTVNVYTRDGSALGGPVETGVGSSPAGWTLRGTAVATQGSGGVSLPITLPELTVSAGRTLGIALAFPDTGPRYFGTGISTIEYYSDGVLTLRTGDARNAPFTNSGSFFSSRALVGSLTYRLADPVLVANPGPSNNSGFPNAGLFFNLQSPSGALLTGLEVASEAIPGGSFQLEVYTRAGTALGNTSSAGPATSMAGWTLHATVDAAQGAGQLSLPITLPPLPIPAAQTVGVGLVFRSAGPRYFGTGAPPHETYTSPGLTITTGEALSQPFTTTGNHFSSRALVGSLSWHPLREVLSANQHPGNNLGALGSGMFMDLIADTPLEVNALRLASTEAPGGTFVARMYTRAGSALGSTQISGPSSSSAGWTLHATLNLVQAATGELSLPVNFPVLSLDAGETIGIGLVFDDASPRYLGAGVTALGVHSGGGLTLVTGEARQSPFTSSGNFFVSRELIGTIYFSADGIFEDGFE